MTIFVSVVVPTYKRPELLRRCLAALLKQKLDPAVYEIIVVDDAACRRTERLVKELAARNEVCRERVVIAQPVVRAAPALAHSLERNSAPRPAAGLPAGLAEQDRPNGAAVPYPALWHSRPCIRYIATPGACGPAAARNRGWQAAQGEIIAFTDDDCIPQPEWLQAGLAAFVGSTVLGASGRIVVPLPPIPTDYERDAAGLERTKFATANCFYRRKALAAAGGFDERFRSAWREDSDLFFTLLEQGQAHPARAGLVRAPKAVVVHPVRPACWGVSVKQQRKSMFNALLYKKHPRLYRQYIRAWPPVHYYASVLALLLAAAGGLGGAARVAVAAAVVWLFITGGFCAWRLQSTARTPAHVGEMVVTSFLIPPLSVFWRLVGAVKFRVLFL